MAKTDNRTHPFIYPVLEQAGGGPYAATLTGTLTIDHVGPRVLLLNTGTAARIVVIPNATPATKGDKFTIRATGSSGFAITVKNASGTTLVTLADGDTATIWNANGTYYTSVSQATIGSDADAFDRTVGGRINSFTSASDTITAAASANAYVDFANPVGLPGGLITAGTRLSILADVIVSDAAAGTATLKTKLTISPREVWTYRIDTATDAEAYGVNLTNPAAGSIAVTSAVSTTKALIAAQIVAAWNTDATCSLYATAASDGVDTVTFTAITDRYVKIAEDENSGKTTLTQTTTITDLIESTAVDQASADLQALAFDLNSLETPSVDSPLTGFGTWRTRTGSTLAQNVVSRASTDFDTTARLVIRAWALWSAADATTTARCNFLSVRSE